MIYLIYFDLKNHQIKFDPVIIGFPIYSYVYNTWDVNELKQFKLDTFQLLTMQFITIQYVYSITRSFINKKNRSTQRAAAITQFVYNAATMG